MSAEPTPLDRLILWRLAVAGGAASNPLLRPRLDREGRDRLTRLGLIASERRRSPTGPGRPYHIELTDRGWSWLADHMTDPQLSPRANAVPTLELMLARLGAHLAARGFALADVMTEPLPPPLGKSPGVDVDGTNLDDRDGAAARIEKAYLKLTDGKEHVRIRLADLRESLPELDRRAADDALLDLAHRGRAALYSLDNPLDVEPRDREAALTIPSGKQRHLIYLGSPSS